MRFVRKLCGVRAPEAHAVIVTEPGEEAQVDYGEGPMVRAPATGKYRRTRLFVMTPTAPARSALGSDGGPFRNAKNAPFRSTAPPD
jgi:hypothetical protein